MYEVTEKSTVHGIKTPHGFKTPHKFPVSGIANLAGIMSDLASQLYPTGRAWYMNKGGVLDRFHLAFNVSFIRLINDAKATIDSSFPDNTNFSADDCALWEYRFGIVTNPALSLPERRAALLRRMGRGRNVPARQHKNYIQYQLQIAGFNVFVHENGFIEGGVKVYKNPNDIIAGGSGVVQHGGTSQHGIGMQHGGGSAQVIANSYKPNEPYSVADDKLWATFFIGGEILGEMAEVPAKRQEEFRELVLKLKPAHLVAFTFINYV
jgi:hypothetical protein